MSHLRRHTSMAHPHRCFHLICLISGLLRTEWHCTDRLIDISPTPLLVLLSPVRTGQFKPLSLASHGHGGVLLVTQRWWKEDLIKWGAGDKWGSRCEVKSLSADNQTVAGNWDAVVNFNWLLLLGMSWSSFLGLDPNPGCPLILCNCNRVQSSTYFYLNVD